MEINDMQRQMYQIIEDWNKKNGKEHNKESVFPHFIEEVGEFAREYGHYVNNWREQWDKEKFDKELIDVFCQLLVLAKDFDVDLEKTFTNKIFEWRQRFELD